MAYNGAGLFARLYNFVSDRNAAIKIRADRMDAEMDGFATGLSTCITKDGQTTITQDIPFNNKKITGLADATAGTDALNRQTADARYRAVGQCRLAKSGANIVLSRFNGTILVINGNAETIPSAGVSLAPTGLSVGTLYYIYAYMNSGTMTLEASTTAQATDTTTGVEIKTGDATRTLVGMVRPITGPAFADTTTQRFVRSWFNRPQPNVSGAFTATRTFTNTASFAEVNTEIRVEWLQWSDELSSLFSTGPIVSSSTSVSALYGIAIDGTSPDTQEVCSATNFIPTGAKAFSTSAGYHYATIVAVLNSAGTGTMGSTGSSVFNKITGTIGC